MEKLIEILVAPGCSSHQPTKVMIEKVVEETGVQATVKEIIVTNIGQALAVKFLGSPSVRVNGIDVEPESKNQKGYGIS